MSDFPNLVEAVYARRAAEYKIAPCHSNRASKLGQECERALVYARTHWAEAQKPDIHTILLLQEGSKHEEAVLQDLRKAGFAVVEQQAALEWREFNITGHLDAVVVHEGKTVPVDVKSASSWIWDTIAKRGPGVYEWDEVKDAFQAKSWLKSYFGQIQLYAMMKGVEFGILLFINKSTGALAQVNVKVDYEYTEGLLQRAKRINAHVERGTLPDRIPYSEKTCPSCPHFTTCLPDMVGHDPIAFLENSKVEELLEVRVKHQDARDAWEEADERVKGWLKARPERAAAVGRFTLTKSPHGKGTRIDIKEIHP